MSMLRELTRNRKADAALENERVTRSRVDRLEDAHKKLKAYVDDVRAESLEVLDRTFWGRLKWLVRGL